MGFRLKGAGLRVMGFRLKHADPVRTSHGLSRLGMCFHKVFCSTRKQASSWLVSSPNAM